MRIAARQVNSRGARKPYAEKSPMIMPRANPASETSFIKCGVRLLQLVIKQQNQLRIITTIIQ